jgi:hypothetical protein
MMKRCHSCVGFWVRLHQDTCLECNGRGVMSFASCKQLARSGIRAMVMLLVLAPFAPGSARAGCGHFALSKGQESRTFANLDRLITGANSWSVPGDLAGPLPGRHDPGRPIPCSGPSCSGRVPLSSPVSTAFSGVDNLSDWGLLSFESLAPWRSTVRRHRDCEFLPHPYMGLSPVFHPPRSRA